MGFTDEGTIVLGWLTKLAAALALVGLIAFDVMAWTTTSLGVADDANAGARAGARAYEDTHNVDRAYEAALAAVRALHPDGTIVPGTFIATPQGRVTLTVQRETTTIVARHIPSIKDHLTVRGDGEATS